jgi:ribosomal protein S20
MESDKKYDEIKEQVKTLNTKFNSAVSEEDRQDWNTQMNKAGKLIEGYGRTSYNRTKKHYTWN